MEKYQPKELMEEAVKRIEYGIDFAKLKITIEKDN
jgi:hypothetical protein